MEHAPAWLVNSFIYLAAAVIVVPLSRALGLGAIIGYLGAGMAIGAWFCGGPREAVMHGIYRHNKGYTHLVIGRKHADAPYANGEAIWGDFDAQEIFKKLGGDLKIKTINVGFAAYYESVGRVDLMERHKDEKPWSISGKDIRSTLQKGELVDPRIMRPSTHRFWQQP